ncbi:GNAT family N-acetyltransferase [Streptomyces shenzhenensis]|uniref:GNAT family N-acetyltransferase n=1 Tax=Streptomyces shenzhenensis TaxID=943815 RepID=A0A3M0I3T0_9ACTN|nr:GNAT family N-acetyltransferase [Streptomyces shenzhenensis]RMB83018.1 GNAT family N-acetyltransferase [Streptomyces shenzhenensis]
MDHAAVLAHYDRDLRKDARPDGPDARIERSATVVRQVAGAHGWNGVLWSGLDGTGADAAIAGQIEHYTALGRAFEWKLHGHDLPADLGSRLVAAGFTPEPEETLMVAETAEVIALTADAEPPEGVRVLRADGAAGVERVVEVHEKVFGVDGGGLRHRLLTRLAADPGSLVAVVALAGDEAVSAARLESVTGTRFAGLWGGGTLEHWRGRGLYRTLVAHRARAAAARGHRYLQVDALPMSRRVLERLGFHALTTTTPHLYGA